MATINDLKALLRHEIKDLMSAEDQIVEALPAMIDKATNEELKAALEEHLTVTEMQRERLDEVQGLLGEADKESKGFLERMFGGGEKCKAMEGIITEGEKMMGEDMSPAVMDAAIIAAAQKVEHYEIASYGTVVSYARQLGENKVADLLEQTLAEEYEADDSLTLLAEGDVNKRAERRRSLSSGNTGRSGTKGSKAASPSASSGRGSSSSSGKGGSSSAGRSGGKKAAARKVSTSNKKAAAKKAATSNKKAAAKAASSRNSGGGSNKKAAAKSASQKGGNKKAAARKR